MRLKYDVVVVGAGHAGCEAASAAARLGSRTLLITIDMEKMASMSCNPAVGGVAKGQIVREIDALGGRMGRITDLSTIQFRMLNRSKGAAMWSPRAQCDKAEFSRAWRRELENTQNLYLWQDSVCGLLLDHSEGRCAVRGVKTRMGVEIECQKLILTVGTFLEGMMHCGEASAEGGRAGDEAAHGITAQLRSEGFEAGRMKTGTPARLDARTINFDALELQEGDAEPSKFSYDDDTQAVKNQLPCFMVYTSKQVHDILRRYTTFYARASTARHSLRGASRVSAHATAQVSRISSAPLPIRNNTSSSSSPRVAIPTSTTSMASPHRYPTRCSSMHYTISWVLRMYTSTAQDMLSNTTTSHLRSCDTPSRQS